jgi:hypothetical protein
MQVALCNQVDRAQRADVGPVSAAVGVSQFAALGLSNGSNLAQMSLHLRAMDLL